MHHVLVATSPLYLIGLEAVITQNSPDPVISVCRSPEEARHKLVNIPRGFLWWAIQNAQDETYSPILLSLVSKYPELRIIMVQHVYKAERVKDLFEKGVVAFISDMCTTEEICEAIHSTSSGRKYVDRRVAISLSDIYLDRQVNHERKSDSLTEREREVLKLIIDEYTTKEIAEKLYISKCTVETHRLHLIRKLGVKNTAGLVREALTKSLYNNSQ